MKKQNYPESKKILEAINRAQKILLNCHRGPDPDSIGSALALYSVLKDIGKEVEIVCPSDKIPRPLKFLKSFDQIQYPTDFAKFDFSKFDLFIALDSSSWGMVTNDKELPQPEIPMVVIDHHKTNKKYGTINLVDDKATSVAELLYLVLEDWSVKINKEIASGLLTGIIGDTGAFRFPGTGWKTLKIAGELMELGADKDKIIFYIYRSFDFNLIKFWGEVLREMKIDKKHRFIWSAMPYKKFVELGRLPDGRETAASFFAQIIEGIDFGFIAVEQEKNQLVIGLRSRTGFDTSKIAVELGGGGSVYASGATIKLPFDKALEKVLELCRKHARKTKKGN